jgi:hypothetical protein
VNRTLPFAIEVQNLDSPDEGGGALQCLRKGDYMLVLRRERSETSLEAGATRVLEAFANQVETEALTAYLHAYGLTPQVVER